MDTTPSEDTIMKLDALQGSSGMAETGACESIDETATNMQQPADIIFVLDNSGSMDLERDLLRDQMNNFSTQIGASGIDYHVVMISTYEDNDGVCIDPPLGGGGCPVDDNNPPIYLHVVQDVGSTSQWTDLIATHDQWASMIRPEAQLHVVAVTDDSDDLSAAEFDAMFTALDPSYAGYIFHAISPSVNLITCLLSNPACCIVVGSENDMSMYPDAVNNTGGVYGDLCDLQASFQPVFDELTTAVISGSVLSCQWAIPDPPDGEDLDPDKVNVEFDDGAGGMLEIGRVDDPSECANVTDGWYYDDPANPTQILLCDQTCTKVQGFANATISIQFGCETIPAG